MHSKQKFTALFLIAFIQEVMNPCLTATVAWRFAVKRL